MEFSDILVFHVARVPQRRRHPCFTCVNGETIHCMGMLLFKSAGLASIFHDSQELWYSLFHAREIPMEPEAADFSAAEVGAPARVRYAPATAAGVAVAPVAPVAPVASAASAPVASAPAASAAVPVPAVAVAPGAVAPVVAPASTQAGEDVEDSAEDKVTGGEFSLGFPGPCRLICSCGGCGACGDEKTMQPLFVSSGHMWL